MKILSGCAKFLEVVLKKKSGKANNASNSFSARALPQKKVYLEELINGIRGLRALFHK